MDKTKNIYELSQEAAGALAAGEWPQFLKTAAWNFRFPFLAQTMIYAQRPEAINCYSFEDWNKKFNRRIKRGSKGIALLDDSQDQIAISYVFDYSDTYSPLGNKLSPWEMTKEKEKTVRNVLTNEFLVDNPFSEDISLYDFLHAVVSSYYTEYMTDTAAEDLLSLAEGSRLSEISGQVIEQESLFRELLINSATAVIMYRCGLDPTEYMPPNVFDTARYFDTFESMALLGNSTQKISKQVLSLTAKTIAKWDKAQKKKETKKNHENEDNLSAGRGISDTEPEADRAADSRQVREDAQEVSEREQGASIHSPSDDRDSESASYSNRNPDPSVDEGNHSGSSAEESGTGERAGEPGVDGAHGDDTHAGTGTGISGDDLYLKRFSDWQIEEVLLMGSGFENGKYRIQKAALDEPAKLASFLQSEYGLGGSTVRFADGTSGFANHSSKGIEITASGFHSMLLSWSAVKNRIALLVEADRYLNEKEKAEAEKYYTKQAALKERRELGDSISSLLKTYGIKYKVHQADISQDINAYVFENSYKARLNLLVHLSMVSDTPDNHEALTKAVMALQDGRESLAKEDIPSATDAGFKNPFPTEEDLKSSKNGQNKLLGAFNEEPVVDTPNGARTPTGEISSNQDAIIDETPYHVDNADDKPVTTQDVEYPPIAESIPKSDFDTLPENFGQTEQEGAPHNGLEAKTEGFVPSKEAVKGTTVTDKGAADISESDSIVLHVGDEYRDKYGHGIITQIFDEEYEGRHQAMFTYTDPEAHAGSRDAKGFGMMTSIAIERIKNGEATLIPAVEVKNRNSRETEENENLTLFDFDFPETSENFSKPVITNGEREETSLHEPLNYRLPERTESFGGPKARYSNNINAIRLLKKLETENRLATGEEQEVLAKYVGWGGLQEAFDPQAEKWEKEYKELKELLTVDEYEAARASTLTAFYTPPEVIDAVYAALGNFGFKRGNILDPGCGIGNFAGRIPEEMAESRIYGIEKDSLSGRIARQLYQKNNIDIEGYEETSLPDNFFDVAIGNVPFGNFKVRDKKYDKLNLQIHDYFFAKTLDKVRPGGVIAFVTSAGTMDKQNDSFRKYIAQKADLLGAIRLPNNTFKTNAGTDVTSDIIFLQKREFPRVEEPEWVTLDRMIVESDKVNEYGYKDWEYGPEINYYFASNPEMIIGEMKEISGPHGPELACIAREDQDLRASLMDAVNAIEGKISQPEEGLYDQEFEERDCIPADPSVRNYSFTLVDDAIYFREDSEMYRPKLNKTAEQRVRGLIHLRERVRNLIDAQVEGYPDETIKDLQKLLNEDYDEFTAKYGIINSRGNEMAFSDDSSYYLLCSLEHVNDKGEFIGKADMFTKRTIHAHEKIDHVDTAQEALAVSLGEKGRIDFTFMSELCGMSISKLTKELQGQIFENPETPGQYIVSSLYLSGNVREKLEEARKGAQDDPERWQANVSALEKVQPEDLEPGDIAVRLGATWIPEQDVTQFMWELLNTPEHYRTSSWGHMTAHYSPLTNTWNISNVKYDSSNSKANSTYGTKRISAYELIEKALNLKDVKIYDTVYQDGVDKRVLNENDTLEAQEKMQLIKDAFKEWIWADSDRAERLCKAYNERFNSFVPPHFDGSLVRYHNMNPSVKMRPWQSDAVARIIFSGNTLLAHAVGAGKTWTMSAAAMELKHLGLCNKSLIVVPNHLVGQWATAIYDQYPNANIITSTKKDFEMQKRKKFCSRIATGDYDIAVIGHSQFERIPLSKARQEQGINEEIDKITDAIIELKAEKDEHFTIKQLERMKKSLEVRLDKLNNSKKRDDVITFEELGVDRLFIDESHEYKNLFLYTKMTNVAGISQTDSQKASDLFLKCRYIDEITDNKGNIHATGTPLSNTMAELYATQRYLQHDLLKDMGLETFDQWASTFGETITSVELAPEGKGYRARTRFANFFNIPELMSLYSQVADIQTTDMLDLPLPTAHYEVITVPASETQLEIVQSLAERAKKIRNGGVKSEEDNMLCVTNDGRKLALDQRLIDPTLPDEPDSKVNSCADNVYRLWKEGEADKLTQLVFCDISTPTGKGFNVYDDLKAKLIARGVPEEEIKFVHEAKNDTQREALFQQVREGTVRILLGSTKKLGTGTNVQDKLVAIHDLDCPWRPSDLEQRSGRVVRQHNGNKDVYIYRYVTENTFDAYMWQLVENKQRFISQVYTSKPAVRHASDVDEIVLSFAEIKALASGDPRIKERVELEGDIQRLTMLKSRHENSQHRLNMQITKLLPEEIQKTQKYIENYSKDMAVINDYPYRDAEGELIPVNINGVLFDKPQEVSEAILDAVDNSKKHEKTAIGKFRGFTVRANLTDTDFNGKIVPKVDLVGPGTTYTIIIGKDNLRVLQRLNHILNETVPSRLKECRHDLIQLQDQLSSAKTEYGIPFPREKELKEKEARLSELAKELDIDSREDNSAAYSDNGVEVTSTKPSLDSLIASAAQHATQFPSKHSQYSPDIYRS